MEKEIKLIMDSNRDVQICIDDDVIHTIESDNRSISADRVYEIIGFSDGNHYSITSENEKNYDEQVLLFFVELFRDITDKLNQLGDNNQ